uniref:K Homology domain-containing protein n=1 Tax=Chromera velia CCMP2878 TaxID=1169474 RepID=A0A0G4IAE9_9ALVE|eukprot:Cvel_12524.t1-p1 / transcript=Cvel_12524.t1 / gene=Cvel_12524 / organism=Chromera_velia_CCMP2878 / gene_product=hypothetical protein / transcript_product=hypothetical protein / location=Cvel_scaffold822:25399-29956(-) / protein_length=679 / sequence_SO=supercontig / SO=protein_coding / is_pseudo=false
MTGSPTAIESRKGQTFRLGKIIRSGDCPEQYVDILLALKNRGFVEDFGIDQEGQVCLTTEKSMEKKVKQFLSVHSDLQEEMKSIEEQQGGKNMVYHEFFVPSRIMGKIVGPEGRRISELAEKCKIVRYEVEHSFSGIRLFKVWGASQANVEAFQAGCQWGSTKVTVDEQLILFAQQNNQAALQCAQQTKSKTHLGPGLGLTGLSIADKNTFQLRGTHADMQAFATFLQQKLQEVEKNSSSSTEKGVSKEDKSIEEGQGEARGKGAESGTEEGVQETTTDQTAADTSAREPETTHTPLWQRFVRDVPPKEPPPRLGLGGANVVPFASGSPVEGSTSNSNGGAPSPSCPLNPSPPRGLPEGPAHPLAPQPHPIILKSPTTSERDRTSAGPPSTSTRPLSGSVAAGPSLGGSTGPPQQQGTSPPLPLQHPQQTAPQHLGLGVAPLQKVPTNVLLQTQQQHMTPPQQHGTVLGSAFPTITASVQQQQVSTAGGSLFPSPSTSAVLTPSGSFPALRMEDPPVPAPMEGTVAPDMPSPLRQMPLQQQPQTANGGGGSGGGRGLHQHHPAGGMHGGGGGGYRKGGHHQGGGGNQAWGHGGAHGAPYFQQSSYHHHRQEYHDPYHRSRGGTWVVAGQQQHYGGGGEGQDGTSSQGGGGYRNDDGGRGRGGGRGGRGKGRGGKRNNWS